MTCGLKMGVNVAVHTRHIFLGRLCLKPSQIQSPALLNHKEYGKLSPTRRKPNLLWNVTFKHLKDIHNRVDPVTALKHWTALRREVREKPITGRTLLTRVIANVIIMTMAVNMLFIKLIIIIIIIIRTLALIISIADATIEDSWIITRVRVTIKTFWDVVIVTVLVTKLSVIKVTGLVAGF